MRTILEVSIRCIYYFLIDTIFPIAIVFVVMTSNQVKSPECFILPQQHYLILDHLSYSIVLLIPIVDCLRDSNSLACLVDNNDPEITKFHSKSQNNFIITKIQISDKTTEN